MKKPQLNTNNLPDKYILHLFLPKSILEFLLIDLLIIGTQQPGPSAWAGISRPFRACLYLLIIFVLKFLSAICFGLVYYYSLINSFSLQRASLYNRELLVLDY